MRRFERKRKKKGIFPPPLFPSRIPTLTRRKERLEREELRKCRRRREREGGFCEREAEGEEEEDGRKEKAKHSLPSDRDRLDHFSHCTTFRDLTFQVRHPRRGRRGSLLAAAAVVQRDLAVHRVRGRRLLLLLPAVAAEQAAEEAAAAAALLATRLQRLESEEGGEETQSQFRTFTAFDLKI